MNLIENIRTSASKLQRRICFPEAVEDQRVMSAAAVLAEEKIVIPLITGTREALDRAADSAGVTLEGIETIDIENFDRIDEMVSVYIQNRAKENLDESQAGEVLTDPLYFGAMLVKLGLADGMVAGAINATGDLLRAAIKCVGPKKGIKTISSSFLMILPQDNPAGRQVFTFSDCAFVPQPDAGQLADIAEAASETHRKLTGEEPLVAMLSFSTKGSADTEDTRKVVEALNIVKKRSPQLKIDGELQLDTAVVESVAARKAPGSEIGGKANVLVFPDLDAANIGYKLTQRLGGADAIGPIAQGMAAPINDLSRGCSIEDIIQVAAITALEV